MPKRSLETGSKLEPDALVRRLAPDASAVPDVRVLAGFLGESPQEGHWRLYLSPSLDEHVEFAEEDVVHHQRLESHGAGPGGTLIWVRREANLKHTRSVSREAQADFLQGAIAKSALACGPGRRGAFPHHAQLNPQRAQIFLSFAGHANSCVSDICDLMAPSWMSGGDVICTFNC